VNNLAASPKHQALIRRYSQILDRWMEETRDQGGLPETESAKAEAAS